MTVDIICPLCGALNKGLNLEETDGWMECIKCRQSVGFPQYMRFKEVPLLRTTLA